MAEATGGPPSAVHEVPEPELAPPVAAPSEAAKPKPVSPLRIPPRSSRRTLAHVLEPKARIGVYLGLPDGWRNDDPSYLLFFPRGSDPKPPTRAVAMTLIESGLVDANKRRLLKRGPEPTGLRDATWSPWRTERVGRDGFEAIVADGQGRSVRGSEGARRAIAVIVDVPGAPALGFIGSWAADAPRHEAAILDMVRAIERCQIEVGRGCVTADERKRAAL